MSFKEYSNAKKEVLHYEKEYSKIKTFLEDRNFDEGHSYLTLLREKQGRKISAHDQLIIEVLTCILNIHEHKPAKNLELIAKLKDSNSDQIMMFDITIAEADAFRQTGKHQNAISAYEEIEQSIALYKNAKIINNDSNVFDIIEREADVQNRKGATCLFVGDILKAQESFQKSLRLREKLPNKKKFADTLNNLGLMYTYQGELQLALDHLMRALKIDKELANSLNIAYSYVNIGKIYQYMGEYYIISIKGSKILINSSIQKCKRKTFHNNNFRMFFIFQDEKKNHYGK